MNRGQKEGRGEAQGADHSWPAYPQVRPQAVEGLFARLVVAESQLLGQKPATVGPSEPASRHREGVHQGDLRVEAHPEQQVLPQPLLGDPQICHLAGEGGAVNFP